MSSSPSSTGQAPAPASASAPAKAPVINEPVSIIPPRAPKRLGMPKLQLPSRPSSSASNSTGLAPRSLGGGSNGASSSSLSLAIPSAQASQGGTDNDEGYEGSAGTSSAATSSIGLPNASLPLPSAAATVIPGNRSIYPETQPHGEGTDYRALTNDLKRAMGGLKMEERATSESGLPSKLPVAGGKKDATRDATGAARIPSGQVADHDGTNGNRDVCGGASTGEGHKGRGGAADEDAELQLKGNLEILSRLGEGASGEVKKALHRPTGLVMAHKTISTSPNPDIHRQILRELSFNRTCHSEYIVKYYGAFLDDEDTSIVICMEHCEAGSLDGIYKRIKSRNGRMGEKILGKVAEEGLKGLAYLHERRIIHRDIKPSNILVTRQGQIKLCDFGVSGELVNSMAGTFTGTSYYMAPERIQGLNYTITSDVWSLGLTILELASNRFPFPAEGEPPLGPIDLLSYVITMKVPELQDDEAAGIKWSKALRNFIETCLVKDPARRPGPVKMMGHPFIKRSESRQPPTDIAKFVADVWGWPPPPTAHSGHAVNSPIDTPTSSNSGGSGNSAGTASSHFISGAKLVNVPGLGRVASIRQAPSPLSAATSTASPTPTSSLMEGAAPARRVPNLSLVTDRKLRKDTEMMDQDSDLGDTSGESSWIRQQEAKMREADVGLVGSPTEEC